LDRRPLRYRESFLWERLSVRNLHLHRGCVASRHGRRFSGHGLQQLHRHRGWRRCVKNLGIESRGLRRLCFVAGLGNRLRNGLCGNGLDRGRRRRIYRQSALLAESLPGREFSSALPADWTRWLRCWRGLGSCRGTGALRRVGGGRAFAHRVAALSAESLARHQGRPALSADWGCRPSLVRRRLGPVTARRSPCRL
jgi:hypothetical protein